MASIPTQPHAEVATTNLQTVCSPPKTLHVAVHLSTTGTIECFFVGDKDDPTEATRYSLIEVPPWLQEYDSTHTPVTKAYDGGKPYAPDAQAQNWTEYILLSGYNYALVRAGSKIPFRNAFKYPFGPQNCARINTMTSTDWVLAVIELLTKVQYLSGETRGVDSEILKMITALQVRLRNVATVLS